MLPSPYLPYIATDSYILFMSQPDLFVMRSKNISWKLQWYFSSQDHMYLSCVYEQKDLIFHYYYFWQDFVGEVCFHISVQQYPLNFPLLLQVFPCGYTYSFTEKSFLFCQYFHLCFPHYSSYILKNRHFNWLTETLSPQNGKSNIYKLECKYNVLFKLQLFQISSTIKQAIVF